MVKGIIINFHIAYTKEVLVQIPGITSRREASKLIGKKAVWKDTKTYVGKVSGVHGNSGVVKVKFDAPLPPTSLGKIVEIFE